MFSFYTYKFLRLLFFYLLWFPMLDIHMYVYIQCGGSHNKNNICADIPQKNHIKSIIAYTCLWRMFLPQVIKLQLSKCTITYIYTNTYIETKYNTMCKQMCHTQTRLQYVEFGPFLLRLQHCDCYFLVDCAQTNCRRANNNNSFNK